MSNGAGLPRINDQNLRELLEAERSALILAKSDCGHCARYEREILALQQRGQLPGLVVGKMVLDAPGSGRFKQENPWLSTLEHLPYTLLFLQGQHVDDFAASHGSYLRERAQACLVVQAV